MSMAFGGPMGAGGGMGPNRRARELAMKDPTVKSHKLKSGTLRRIAGFAAPYKKVLALFLITVIIDALLVVATPLLLKELIDQGVSKSNNSLVTKLAIFVAILALTDAAVNTASRWYSSQIGEGLIYDLRTTVFDHVQKQSIAFFTRTQTGALISRLNSDVIGAQQAFTSTLSGVISNSLSLILVVIAMTALNWQITLLSLVLAPLFLAPSKWIGSKMSQLTRESFTLNAEMSATMTERFNVAGALLVKLYGDGEREHKTFAAKARKVADIGIKNAMLNRTFVTALTTIAALATAIAYGFGGHLAIKHVITIGTLLAVTNLLARLYGPITSLSNVRVDVMTALVSFERVFELLDLEPMVASPLSPKQIPSGLPTIDFEDVYFSYPRADQISLASLEMTAKKEVVDSGQILGGISFHLPAGSMTAIVGPSGAGKSTISGLLPRLYDVSSGAIKVSGVDIRELDLIQLRERIGVVTQDSHLFHDTIAANLRYADPAATDEQMWQACQAAQIADFIRSLPNGFETIVGDRGHRLSGGEKQRVAIARLLIKNPELVIMDEATAHLDSENEALVQEALKGALKGRTSIVIAHRLSTIVHADLILVLADGQIAERGTHEELVAKGGLYFDLYQRQTLSA